MLKKIWGLAICGLTCASLSAADVPVNSARVESGYGPVRVSSLIGTNLKDSDGQDLGKVTDVVINMEKREVEYLLLSSPQNSDAYYAVPPTVFQSRIVANQSAPQWYVGVPATQFRQAPTFTQQQWTTNGFDPTWRQRNHTFYSPFFVNPAR